MRGGTKMKYSITFNSYHERELLCEELASDCHYNCPAGKLPCPFGSKDCDDVTAADWAKIIKVIKMVQE